MEKIIIPVTKEMMTFNWSRYIDN